MANKPIALNKLLDMATELTEEERQKAGLRPKSEKPKEQSADAGSQKTVAANKENVPCFLNDKKWRASAELLNGSDDKKPVRPSTDAKAKKGTNDKKQLHPYVENLIGLDFSKSIDTPVSRSKVVLPFKIPALPPIDKRSAGEGAAGKGPAPFRGALKRPPFDLDAIMEAEGETNRPYVPIQRPIHPSMVAYHERYEANKYRYCKDNFAPEKDESLNKKQDILDSYFTGEDDKLVGLFEARKKVIDINTMEITDSDIREWRIWNAKHPDFEQSGYSDFICDCGLVVELCKTMKGHVDLIEKAMIAQNRLPKWAEKKRTQK